MRASPKSQILTSSLQACQSLLSRDSGLQMTSKVMATFSVPPYSLHAVLLKTRTLYSSDL